MTIYCTAVIPLMWIAIADAMKRTIPQAPLVLLVALGLARIIFQGWSCLIYAIVGLMVIGGPMLFLACFLEHGNGIGGGDVKLCAAMGFLLGTTYALVMLIAALLLLAIYAILAGEKTGQPFAPFVLLGYDLVLIFLILFGG